MKMLYVYKFRRLIAGCRRPVAGEKGERLIQVEPNNSSSLRSGAWGVNSGNVRPMAYFTPGFIHCIPVSLLFYYKKYHSFLPFWM